MSLSKEELERYGRQISIEEIGEAGQRRLKEAVVALVGAGGLGSSAGFYLAAAGIGELRLIDSDSVELSNLNRQVLHAESDIGRPKTDSAIEKLGALNSTIRVTGSAERLTSGNASRLLEGVDAVVDCLDNFETRFVINSAALRLGIPLVHGACYGFEGRATVVLPGKTPCLRCVVPSADAVYAGPTGKPPVLGATPGVIGAVEAAETVKLLTGAGKPLAGRLLVYDGLNGAFDVLTVERDPRCPACGGKA